MNSQMRQYRREALGASVCSPVGHATLLVCGCVHQPGSSPKPHTFGIFLKACSHKHDHLLTPFPGPCPILENQRGVWLKIPNFSSWLGVFGDPSRSHPGDHPKSPHQNKCHSYHPGSSKGFKSPVSGTRVKEEILEQKMFLLLRNYNKVLRTSELGTGGRDQHANFLLSHSY